MNVTRPPRRRSLLRVLGAAAFGLNGAVLVAAGLDLPQILAREEPPAAPHADETPAAPAPATDLLEVTLKRMAGELRDRERSLAEREERAADAERRLGAIAKRLGVDITAPAPDAAADAAAQPARAPEEIAAQGGPPSDLMARLLRSYESMEPENAAAALRRLFGIDRNAVVELISGMSPRKAGAVLDALAGIDPGMTADLSHELWKRGRVIARATGS